MVELQVTLVSDKHANLRVMFLHNDKEKHTTNIMFIHAQRKTEHCRGNVFFSQLNH